MQKHKVINRVSGFLVGKMDEVPARHGKGLHAMTLEIIKTFGKLKSDETIKLPRGGQSNAAAWSKACSLRKIIGRHYPDRIIGSACGEDFIFLFSRGLKDKES